MHEQEGDTSLQKDRLPHESNRAIIGFTKSPKGMDVIGMTLKGKDWILLATMEAITADRLGAQLKSAFGIDSLPGLPFDWRESIRQKEIVLCEGRGKLNNPVGIFVPAEKFDDLQKSTL